MKIFLTGGTGFIGTHFLASPARQGHEVVAQRRAGSRSRLALSEEPEWLDVPLDQVRAEHLAGCDTLVHLSSVGVSPQKASWNEMFHWNVDVPLQLAQAAKAAGVKRLVVAGSFAEYGRSANRHDPIPPTAPLEPTYGYAASKAASFVALHALAIEQDLEFHYLRIFSAYGEGQHEANFWPSLRKAALAGADFEMTPGEQIRDYMEVTSVAHEFWTAATGVAHVAGSPVVRNLGSGQPVSMRRFAEHWWRAWQARGSLLIGALPYRKNEIMRFIPQL